MSFSCKDQIDDQIGNAAQAAWANIHFVFESAKDRLNIEEIEMLMQAQQEICLLYRIHSTCPFNLNQNMNNNIEPECSVKALNLTSEEAEKLRLYNTRESNTVSKIDVPPDKDVIEKDYANSRAMLFANNYLKGLWEDDFLDNNLTNR